MPGTTQGLVDQLMRLPIFHAEWVLWLLLALSLWTLAVAVERFWFYRRHRVDAEALRGPLRTLLGNGDFQGAADLLARHDSLETNVVLFGLRDSDKGPESVEELIGAAMRKERSRYEKRLGMLATIASNAPFIGLFGTVLGVIRAFNDLAGNLSEASTSVMAGIAEALIATAVGLLVAIPAVMAFNFFKARVKAMADNAQLLAATLLAQLKAANLDSR